ncbi:hypothetical protein [Acinetobacter sp. YH12070]|uniref:hypothetical protein n=1 Tax=Acinetobacter sp. YH12070 TaxID=2601066 RepID=UPI0015D12D0D|nr:hypothetical protein [Acinetobacter sp. YH12070]
MSFKQFVLLKDIKIFLLLGFMFPSTLLSGCFPILKTKHPKINITVINEQNEKLDDAEVFLNLTTWQGKSFTESTLKKHRKELLHFLQRKVCNLFIYFQQNIVGRFAFIKMDMVKIVLCQKVKIIEHKI